MHMMQQLKHKKHCQKLIIIGVNSVTFPKEQKQHHLSQKHIGTT